MHPQPFLQSVHRRVGGSPSGYPVGAQCRRLPHALRTLPASLAVQHPRTATVRAPPAPGRVGTTAPAYFRWAQCPGALRRAQRPGLRPYLGAAPVYARRRRPPVPTTPDAGRGGTRHSRGSLAMTTVGVFRIARAQSCSSSISNMSPLIQCYRASSSPLLASHPPHSPSYPRFGRVLRMTQTETRPTRRPPRPPGRSGLSRARRPPGTAALSRSPRPAPRVLFLGRWAADPRC